MFTKAKLFHAAGEGSGGGGGDEHNLGWYATESALTTAHPTATNGDWAIVGTTDTVWTWDSDTTAWVDTDTKGQVTSVNGQTGAVTIGANDVLPTQTGYSGRVLGTDGFVAGWVKPEIVQRSALPVASQDEEGNIYQFVGTTDANYTNGYFYKCVSDGGNPATYSWTAVSVQAGGGSSLPSQTGNSGKFLTTDGTDASWSDKPLVNKATGVSSLAIGSGSASGIGTVSVGSATSSGNSSIFIGSLTAGTNVQDEIAIGWYAAGGAQNGITIGGYTSSGAVPLGTISIGRYANPTPIISENEKGTFWVTLWTSAYSSSTYKLMSSDGTIPTARLTKVNTTVTLTSAGWSGGSQTVTVTGMTATGIALVSPDPTDQSAYTSAGILCTAQAADSLTFTATTTPTSDIDVVVVML